MTAVLYDVPGPRARLRNRVLGVVGVLIVLALTAFVMWRFAAAGLFAAPQWEWLQYEQIQLRLLDALLATLHAFALGAVLALVFGAFFAAARLSDHAWVRGPATLVVEFFRAIPLLILMFIFYNGLPAVGITASLLWSVVLGLMLYNGSVLAEVFRAGILAVPKGQREAAFSLGMRKTQVMTNVLLPQAVRSMLPTIVSQLVVLLKDTALGFIIGYQELLSQARYQGGQPPGFPIIPAAFVVAVIYISMCLLLAWLANYLERRTRRSRRRPGAEIEATEEETAELLSQTRAGSTAAVG